MTRVALYARYSSDQQSAASIADQLRVCREFADRQGWRVAASFKDAAISGASLMRPGFQALMRDALAGAFDVVLAESLDRFSRDQEDTAVFSSASPLPAFALSPSPKATSDSFTSGSKGR